jgi:hypothetical protein
MLKGSDPSLSRAVAVKGVPKTTLERSKAKQKVRI